MGFRRTDRLSDLMKLKTLILKTCSACGHQALFNPADVLQYLAADREVGALPFRCNCCGSGFVLAAPDPESLLDEGHEPKKPKPLWQILRAELTHIPIDLPLD
jgi:hypothetical protein